MMWKEKIMANKMHYPGAHWRTEENHENISQNS
jgi:hypothetical protein